MDGVRRRSSAAYTAIPNPPILEEGRREEGGVGGVRGMSTCARACALRGQRLLGWLQPQQYTVKIITELQKGGFC